MRCKHCKIVSLVEAGNPNEAAEKVSHCAQQPNEALTCDGCCENKPDEPWREICSECKRKPRQDLYAHKPEEGEEK